MKADADLPVAGALLITPDIHHDARGFFATTADDDLIPEAPWSRYCVARSQRGVIRGLHVRPGAGEAKLVRCARGAVFDVIADLRQDSPTFMATFSIQLDGDKQISLYVPPGCAHGYQALSGIADVAYRIDGRYDPDADLAVAWDDPELAISWPLPPWHMSQRDQAGLSAAGAVRLL